MKKKHITLINIASNMLLQLSTIICGFILPKLILNYFGSEVNGLVSSINQFLNYINIIEGGLGGIVSAALYKPLYNNDIKKINSIINTTNKLYKKVALLFLLYSIILSLVYPLMIKSSFSYSYVFSLILILSITVFVYYNFSVSYKLLLNADRRIYIVSLTQTGITILNTILFVILIKYYQNIHFLKLITGLVYIIQPIFFNYYVKKKYFINKKEETSLDIIKNRWIGFGINIASFIHDNTDMIVLSLMTDLKIVSIYSVYRLVTLGIKKMIQAISSAIVPSIGRIYAANNKKELKKKFSDYEIIVIISSSICFSIALLLITPFVMFYTKNITDTNYNNELFGFLLVLSEYLFCIREPYINITTIANKFKDIKKYAYNEAILNILLSILFVKLYGLIGVVLGTSISIIYRFICHIIYLKHNIINIKASEILKKFLVLICPSIFLIVLLYNFFYISSFNLLSLLLYGITYLIIFVIVYYILLKLFYKNTKIMNN